MGGHDIVVIGASAGGIDALAKVMSALPSDLPASVFVTMHTAAGYESKLGTILARHTSLKVDLAVHGEPFAKRHIYVAPPDNHLMLRAGFLSVQRGPKENGHRPAVDPLFRSAAQAYGPRVVGVVLSGGLDCGTAGLLSIKARGGIAVVQDPNDAEVPFMPLSALNHVRVDYTLPASEIGSRLAELAHLPVVERLVGEPTHEISEAEGTERGVRSDIVCPLCQGALTEAHLEGMTNFRCHVGHSFSDASLLAEQAESLERAMWAAVRALEESATLAERLAATGGVHMRERLEEKGRSQKHQAALIRRMLLGPGPVTVADGEAEAANGPRKA